MIYILLLIFLKVLVRLFILYLIFLMKMLMDNSKTILFKYIILLYSKYFYHIYFYKILKLLQFKLFRTTKNDMKLVKKSLKVH